MTPHLTLLALLLSCFAVVGQAQTDAPVIGVGDDGLTLSADGMRDLAQSFLDGGRLAEAATLADALLLRDPTDVTALVIRAQAAIAMGDFGTALDLSRRAYRAAGSDNARYVSARLVALSHAESGRDTFAQFWLRRAGEYAPNEEAVQSVAEDYAFLRKRNPLAISLNFGISPSSNVNGGSASEVLILPGLPFEFVLDGEARALSGVQFEAGIAISYRLAATETAATFIDAQVQGRTYALSSDAKALAPDARGSDYADISFTSSLTRRWLPEGATGPWTVSASFGQTWYNNAPYLQFMQVSAAKANRIGDRDRLDLSGFVERQDRLQDDEQFPSLGARARWTHLTETGNKSVLTLSLRDSLTDLEDVGFQGVTVSSDYDLRKPLFGLEMAFGADAEIRDFAQSAYALDGRQDLRGAVRVTVALPGIQYYGFAPTVTFEASRTESDVDLFDQRDLRVNFGVQSSF